MRIWHKDLIPLLPRLQLIAQWRELCAIASKIEKCGTPNHLLVNKVLDYPVEHLIGYTNIVFNVMTKRRGINVSEKKADKYSDILRRCDSAFSEEKHLKPSNIDEVYYGWHTERYLRQCLINLEEKAMCGGILKDEWQHIYEVYGKKYDLWKGE